MSKILLGYLRCHGKNSFCGNQIKPEEDFYCDKRWGNRFPNCKECSKKMKRNWAAAKHESFKDSKTRHYLKNRDEINSGKRLKYRDDPKYRARKIAAVRKWVKDHPEQQKARTAFYRELHREEINSKSMERYRDDPNKFLARSSKWNKENRETLNAWRKSWRKANPEKVKAEQSTRRARKPGGQKSPRWISRRLKRNSIIVVGYVAGLKWKTLK